MDFEKQPDQQSKEKLTMKQRLANRVPGSRIQVIRSNPSMGQITPKEVSSFDPELGPDSDFASVVLVMGVTSDGQLSKESFIEEMTEGDKSLTARASETFENMLQAGLIKIKNGKVFTNMELVRG